MLIYVYICNTNIRMLIYFEGENPCHKVVDIIKSNCEFDVPLHTIMFSVIRCYEKLCTSLLAVEEGF